MSPEESAVTFVTGIRTGILDDYSDSTVAINRYEEEM